MRFGWLILALLPTLLAGQKLCNEQPIVGAYVHSNGDEINMLQIGQLHGKLTAELFYRYDEPNYGAVANTAYLSLRRHPTIDTVFICHIDSINTYFDLGKKKTTALDIPPKFKKFKFSLSTFKNNSEIQIYLNDVTHSFRRINLQDFYSGLFDTYTYKGGSKSEWEQIVISRDSNCIYPKVTYASYKNRNPIRLEVLNFSVDIWSFLEGVDLSLILKFRNSPILYKCQLHVLGEKDLYVRDGLGPGKDQVFRGKPEY